MSVAFDAKGSASAHGAASTSVNFTNLTIGTGTNRALVVTLTFSVAVSAVAVKWNGVSMTQIGSTKKQGTGTANVQLWGLVNPDSGNKTLAVTWTTSASYTVDAIAFLGVNQTGSTTTFPVTTATSGNSGTASISPNTATSNYQVAAFVCSTQTVSSTNLTNIFTDNTNTSNSAGANYAVGTGSGQAMTATLSTTSQWAAVGCAVVSDTGAKTLGAGSTLTSANSFGGDTITGNQSLGGGSTVTSANSFGVASLTGNQSLGIGGTLTSANSFGVDAITGDQSLGAGISIPTSNAFGHASLTGNQSLTQAISVIGINSFGVAIITGSQSLLQALKVTSTNTFGTGGSIVVVASVTSNNSAGPIYKKRTGPLTSPLDIDQRHPAVSWWKNYK